MMQPPPSPVRDGMVTDDVNQATQNTQQATQPDSQDANVDMDKHLWGYLLPCNPKHIRRVDFFRIRTEFKLGRDRANDVVFPGKKVSNNHCQISFKADAVTVKDMSSNGTYINGEKIGRGQFLTLKEGNEIAFGTAQPQTDNDGVEDYRFIFRNTAAQQKDGLYAHYDLIKELGKGSFATVMQAMNKKNGQFYAVKMIQASKVRGHYAPNDGVLDGPSESAKWAREISIMQSLEHENICQLKEVFFESSNINLVLEYVNGGDLLDYILSRNGVSEDECRDITFQLCEAMAYIHRKGITHRDLKPENVLMTDDVPPKVKVADFGLAKMVDSYTMLRTMCGTPSYLAPEVVLQVNHEGYQQVVDSWSVGVIVFCMLSNVAPFETLTQAHIQAAEAGEPLTVKQQVLQRRVNWQFLTQRRVSEQCIDFIRRLLQPRPEKRLKLTAAHGHPWLAGHSHAAYALRINGGGNPGLSNGNGNASASSASGLDGDASMQSAVADASMADVSQSEPAPMPGAFDDGDADGVQGEPSRVRRRRDILITAQEEDGADPIPGPSQEMLDSAHAEEQRYYASNSRPNKRKNGPFDGSLTPMPEDSEEEATNGIQDLSMADVASVVSPSPPPATKTTKRARPASAKTPSPPKKGRGKQSQEAEGTASPAPPETAERPRRSARLEAASPQKPRKAGKR